MSTRNRTGLASAVGVAAAATLAMAVPASAASTGSDGSSGSSSSSVVAPDEQGQGSSSTHRGQSVHDDTTLPWPSTPSSNSSTVEALPVVTGVAGGLALAGIGFAAVTIVRRRHDHGHMAHPA